MQIVETEYIRIETKNSKTLEEVLERIENERLYVTNNQGNNNIRLKLRSFSFHVLSYFKEYFHSMSRNELQTIEEFLEEDEFFIDYDEEYPLSYPIPIAPNIANYFFNLLLKVVEENKANYIWILPEVNSKAYYTINNVKAKLSTTHTNFFWKDLDYNEEKRDHCKLQTENNEITWIELDSVEFIESNEKMIYPKKIYIDHEMKEILKSGAIFSQIAANKELQIFKSN